MMKAVAPLLLCSLLIAGTNAGSYFITAPLTIQPGSVYDLTVDILNTTDVNVEVSFQELKYNGLTNQYDVSTVQTVGGKFDQGKKGKLSLPIASDFHCENCRVNVRGRGGLQFERTLSSVISSNLASILVQTDKAIYKPGQTVNFRILAVKPDLKLYNGSFNIEIRDPNKNKIKVLTRVSDKSGVVEGSLNLSDQPVFGTWTVGVDLVDFRGSYSQPFEVSQYDLPRFEVDVILPPYGLTSDGLLAGKVKATYTFGQPVKGFVELHVGPNQGPNTCGVEPRTTQIGFEIDGEATFAIPKEDIQRAVFIYNYQQVKVTAFVKEDSTGVRLNGSSVVTYYDNKYNVKFTDNTPNVFKPGLPYTAYVQVSTPDDKPPTESDLVVSVYTTVRYQLSVDDQSLYDSYSFIGTYGLPGKNISLPTSGLLPVDVDIPVNATSITIKATLKNIRVSKSVGKMFSASNNFIQLSLLASNVQSGKTVTFNINGTEALNEVSYKVLSRGSVAASGVLNGQGQKSFNFALTVTPAMAPTAHVLVYYTRGSEEVISDSLAFNVDGIFENKVSISFNKNESEPNKNLDVNVTADPHSKVFILAVDQSVLLLKSGNDITSAKVNQAVSGFDRGEKPSSSEFALSYSAQTVQQVFQKTGLTVVTDLSSYNLGTAYPGFDSSGMEGVTISLPSIPSHSSSATLTMSMTSTHAPNPGSVKEVEHVRQFFPEAWLWTTGTAGDDGSAAISTLVPDTITSWIASAFATNPQSGLGVAPSTAKLTVFRPFFVSLTIPNVVTRGEQVVIQATVFNYLPNNADVVVTLRGASTFKSVKVRNDIQSLESGDQLQTISVESQKQGVAFFPIVASEIGQIDIQVSAQSTFAADGVLTQITVQPEGAPVSYNYPIYVNLDKVTSYNDVLDLSVPDNIVPGSQKVRVKVTGDLIGSSLDSPTSLLELPTGCGEQSMVQFAPDVYIAAYLQSTGQETQATHQEIVEILGAGYQRQLSYQRNDGGFSAFGNQDESGSTWLTAYVSRVLYEAQSFTFVDTDVLLRAVGWLVERQNRDGSFNEFGKVLDSSMQGTSSGPALTAFVLLSLLQNKPLARTDCSVDQDCIREFEWGNATLSATKNLESLVDSGSIKDKFSLAIVSYALTLAKSPKATKAFTNLKATARNEGGLEYWSDITSVLTKESSNFLIWRPPHVQSRPLDILITSYAILTYAAQNRLDEAIPSVQWLTTQRNSLGGFASSQDTSVGLQALAAYAAKAVRPDTSLNVVVSNLVSLADFHVDRSNALVLQIKELNNSREATHVDVTGTGFALIEIDVNFHVTSEFVSPSFDVSTVLLDDDLNSFNLMICTKWMWSRDTGMVVQVVSIPSGFEPDLQSLNGVAGLRRSERSGSTLSIYFDKISKTSVCYSVRMTRTGKIAKTQPNYITTYDYYSPSDQSTVFWQSKKLRDSTICDVCEQCCS